MSTTTNDPYDAGWETGYERGAERMRQEVVALLDDQLAEMKDRLGRKDWAAADRAIISHSVKLATLITNLKVI